jgi:hypothetical protein
MFQPPFVCIPRRSDAILTRLLSSLDAKPGSFIEAASLGMAAAALRIYDA